MSFKRSLLATSVAASMMMAGAAHATNGYQLIGIGSYQMGMAGAVTSNPGSAMTAITNPAGIAEITPQADFSMEAFMPKRNVSLQTGAPAIKSDSNLYGVPSLGWTAPISDGSNVYFGGGMYATSGLGVDYLSNMGNGSVFQGYSQLGVFQMAPTLAWKVNDKMTLGASLNIGYMQLGFKQGFTDAASGQPFVGNPQNGHPPAYVDMSQSANAFGFGATIGMMYKINNMVTVGASYRSKQKFQDLKYNLSAGQITVYQPGMGVMRMPAGRYTAKMDIPQQLSAGVTVRPMSGLSISGDVKWINWANTMNDFIITTPSGMKMNLAPGWKNQMVYALAANYQVTPKLAVRAGFNYGKSPVRSETVANNLIFPAVVEQHYTAGMTYDLNNHWNIGAAYMYAPKKTFTAPATAGGSSVDLKEQAFVFNLGYKF